MSKPMSDSGKGSFRRNEDLNKVNEGFDRIFGLSKLEQRLKKEQEETMIEEHEHDEDDGYNICPHCNGSGEGMYDGSVCGFCKGTGEEPVERDCDDFDFPEDDYDYN